MRQQADSFPRKGHRVAWLSISLWLVAVVVICLLFLASTLVHEGSNNPDAAIPLYPDEFVEKWERDERDPQRLKVVPRREAYPRSDVFRRLGIDETRVRKGGDGTVNFATTLWWQVSPSYYLECLTTTNGSNRGLAAFDPRKTVSNLRVLRLQDLEYWQRPEVVESERYRQTHPSMLVRLFQYFLQQPGEQVPRDG